MRPGRRGALVFLWLSFCAAVVTGVWRGHPGPALLAFGLAFAAVQAWWHSLRPSNDRPWADELAQMVHGEVRGNEVILENVRNFEWRTPTDYTARWETRHYGLSSLLSLDMITSYWRGPAIAHLLFSFGFADGNHVVFSVEVRRERNQAFNEIGGFFKEFELSIIAADERDIVFLRTNVRGEDDYLYRLRLPQADIRSLFLAYIEEANQLARQPRFYNTITVNCTTLVYRMLRQIVGALPLDYRLVFSGFLPEYVHALGGLDARYPLAELRRMGRITERARRAGNCPEFSAAIRAGIPQLP
ncbi:MAG: DUF4105 domain-containing protein [Proteobacteria bacterium]|nr:DUF4105 domain-containing protein [Pseudomonadota bacterium]